MSDKQDLTEHGDGELSMWFMNDETLYISMGSSSWESIKLVAGELFIYTSDQLTDLEETFEEENENGDA